MTEDLTAVVEPVAPVPAVEMLYIPDADSPGHFKAVPKHSVVQNAAPVDGAYVNGVSTNGVSAPPLSHSAPGKGGKRASLVQGRNDWDFKVEIDGINVYCLEMAPDLERWVNDEYPQELAAALGCELDVARSNRALKLWIQADSSGGLFQAMRTMQAAYFDRIISRCVVDWDSPEPCESNKLKAPRTVKKRLAERIIAASTLGLEDADFLAPSSNED